jgi:predicted DNA-binding transcriptional regulator
MSKDQALGALILIGSIAVLGVYGFLLYAGYAWLAYGIVITVAVVAVIGIVAWIGWTMATTPAPVPIESLDEVQKTPDEASVKA